MDRELQQDLPTMPPEQQLEAMGLAPQAGAAAEPEDQQQDLPTMPPEQQLEAMGLAPQAGAAAEPEEQQPESEAEVTIEPEMAAYEAEQATAEAPTTTRAGKRQRKG